VRLTLSQALGAVLSVLAVGSAAADSGQGLPPDYAAALERAGVRAEQISVWFGEADSTEARFHWLPEVPRNPASVLKLVTSAQALDQLGPDHRWQTRVLAEGTVRNGHLDGHLLLEASGDPRLRLDDLRELFGQVLASGIRSVGGGLLIDRSRFDLPPHDPAAFDGQAQRAYNVGADALLLNFGALAVHARPDPATDRVQAWLEPRLDGVQLDNQVTLAGTGCNGWRLRPLLELSPARPASSDEPVAVRLRGNMPADCEADSIDIAPLTGDAFRQRLLRQAWREAGGVPLPRIADGRAGYGMRVVGSWRSPPLAELLRDINRYSNNVMAEQVWLTLGGNAAGWPASRQKAATTTRDWLQAIGAWDDDSVIDSGSGLSRRTRVSAEQLHTVLRHMARSPLFPEFAASLPMAGGEGTARHIGASAHARLKTGSLDGVRAAAGYVRDGQGRWLSLVVVIEDAPAAGWRDLLAWLIDWAAATDGPVP